MDTLSPAQRHNNMSHIRSVDTKPELVIRRALHRMGFRFRKNDRRYPGTPDIVLPHFRAVIFVHGCFWHGHETAPGQPCAHYRLPKTNVEFWKAKISRNRERDAREVALLHNDGWRVCIVWECSITGKNRAQKIQNIAEDISLWIEEGFGELYREF